jgi:diguanylate cyclase
MCDLDWFKAINDKFGHPVGDMVLKMFGETLTDNVGEGDIVARVGGEEFAIVFPGVRANEAATVAEQVRKRLEAKKWAVGSSGAVVGRVTASFGVAERREDDDAAELFKRADQALYRAKANGRNRIVID